MNEQAGAVTDPPIDLDQVRREIDEEVRRRRASGDFPPGMERELDLAFARVSPVATTGHDLDGLLQAAERASFVEPNPPTASRIPPLALVKKAERKLLGWYFTHLAQQVTSFAGAAVRAMQVLTERLERVERALPRPDIAELAEPAGTLEAELVASVATLLGGVGEQGPTRVLVAGPDTGLLDALAAAGIDAYGVAPSAAPAAGSAVLDRRAADPLAHLSALAPETLAGVVVLGVDPLTSSTKVAYVEAAAAALVGGGRLVIVAGRPDRWGLANPVEADLAAGRPFQPLTWSAVLAAHGFTGIGFTLAGGGAGAGAGAGGGLVGDRYVATGTLAVGTLRR